MPHGCTFNDLWLDEPAYRPWIKRNETNPNVADCTVCRSSINLSTMGKTALSSHMKGSKHAQRVKFHSNGEKPLSFFFNKKETTSSRSSSSSLPGPSSSSVETAAIDSSSSPTTSTSSSGSIKQFVSKADTLKAEIWWCVRSAMKNHSFSSNSDLGFYLKNMFPNVPEVNALSLGETKSMYMTVYGLAHHFKSILLKDVQPQPFCMLFDESLNKSTMQKQLDVHVRYWSNSSVTTRYVDSFMLGHATANDLVENLSTLKRDLNFANLLQMSMDWPNVNWCAYEKFGKQLTTDYGTGLVNIGSCGLHQVHNSYRAAVNATTWDIDHFLNSVHILFKNVPARRSDFITTTNISMFPLKFAAHRWVENQRVLIRAKEIVAPLQLYVQAVQKKKVKDPATQSYTSVIKFLEDKLLMPKLVFLINMCKPLERFLTVYQQDSPLVPFLYKDLRDLLEKFMHKFVKSSLIEANSIVDIDVSKSENLLGYSKVKVGVEVEELLK